MRTTLDIDEKLIEDAVRLTGEKNKGKAVSKAIEEYARKKRIDALRARLGTVDLDLEDWHEFRHQERRTEW